MPAYSPWRHSGFPAILLKPDRRLSRIIEAPCFPEDFFAMTLISNWPGKLPLFNRKYSRMIRLILFLVTAFPTFLETVMPRRDLENWFFPTTNIKWSLWWRNPFFCKNRYSADDFIRSALVNVNIFNQIEPLSIYVKILGHRFVNQSPSWVAYYANKL